MNIVSTAYETIATARIEQLTAAMDRVITAEINVLHPILKALMLLFIGRQFLLVMLGHMTIERFMGSIIRAGIITLLVVQSGQYVQRIRDPIFTKIPQAIASTVSGTYSGTNATQSIARQFDSASAAADAMTAIVVSRNTAWSVAGLTNSAAAWIANGGMQILLACVMWVWLVGQGSLAIILCFGPPILVFELFDRTRGFVDQFFGKLVGITSFGLATGVLMAIMMQGLLSQMQNATVGMPTGGAEAVSLLIHTAVAIMLDAFSMATLPLIVGFGSGAAASVAGAPTFAALRSVSRPFRSR